MAETDESNNATWAYQFGQVAEGCGCLLVVALFLLLASGDTVIRIIQAIRGH